MDGLTTYKIITYSTWMWLLLFLPRLFLLMMIRSVNQWRIQDFRQGGAQLRAFVRLRMRKPKILPLRFPNAPGSASGCSFIDVWRESGDMFCESISVFKESF